MIPLFSMFTAPLLVARRGARPAHPHRTTAVAVAALSLLFALRVAGQLLVVLAAPSWLPAMHFWYSGLLAYPVLLPTQVVILGIEAWIVRDLWRGEGRFAKRRPRLARPLRAFALLYAGVMVARYAISVAFVPDHGWWGSAIPVAFHQVLAATVFVLARYHGSRDPVAP